MRSLISTKTILHAVAALIIASLCVCMSGHFSILFATDTTVYAIGSSPARPDRPEKAREEAVMDGLMDAVNQLVTQLVSKEDLVRSFETINEKIYPKIRNFIQNYKVLAEYKSDTEYRVLVQADISRKLLTRFLQVEKDTLNPDERFPKILLLISEHHLESEPPIFWWDISAAGEPSSPPPAINYAESEIINVLSERGFPIVKSIPETPENELQIQPPQRPDLTTDEAIQLGQALDSKIVIMGKSAAHRTLNSMNDNTRTYSGVVTLKAFLTETEQEIGFSIKNEIQINDDPADGIREAISAAASQAAAEIAANIENFWIKQITERSVLEVIVGGNAYLRNFVKFREKLEEIPDVQDINLSEMKSDEAVLIVKYKRSGREFAEYLMMTTFENFGLNIYEVSPRQLRIELINK